MPEQSAWQDLCRWEFSEGAYEAEAIEEEDEEEAHEASLAAEDGDSSHSSASSASSVSSAGRTSAGPQRERQGGDETEVEEELRRRRRVVRRLDESPESSDELDEDALADEDYEDDHVGREIPGTDTLASRSTAAASDVHVIQRDRDERVITLASSTTGKNNCYPHYLI